MKISKKLVSNVFVVSLLLGLSSCNNQAPLSSTTKAPHGNAIGGYKGYNAINADLNQRVFKNVDIIIFLQPSAPLQEIGPLSSLLGSFSGQGSGNKFTNGTPNATNMLLWNLLMTNLAKHIGEQCDHVRNKTTAYIGGQAIELQPIFKNILSFLCPMGKETNAPILDLSQTFWLQVMGYQASYDEYQAWLQYVSDNKEGLSGKDRVEAMMLSLLMNPYYLLEQ